MRWIAGFVITSFNSHYMASLRRSVLVNSLFHWWCCCSCCCWTRARIFIGIGIMSMWAHDGQAFGVQCIAHPLRYDWENVHQQQRYAEKHKQKIAPCCSTQPSSQLRHSLIELTRAPVLCINARPAASECVTLCIDSFILINESNSLVLFWFRFHVLTKNTRMW